MQSFYLYKNNVKLDYYLTPYTDYYSGKIVELTVKWGENKQKNSTKNSSNPS